MDHDAEAQPILDADFDDSEIRDKANLTYSTIALVSTLLAGITFSAYIAPPGPPDYYSASSTATPHAQTEVTITNAFLTGFYAIRTIIVPVTFILNLLSTLTAMLVLVYVNSSRTSSADLQKMFADPESEHEIIKVPVSLLLTGVSGTVIGIFVGLPLRYPDQLSSLPCLIVMSSLGILLLLLAVYMLTCADQDAWIFSCLADCCMVSPAFRKVIGHSMALFFSNQKVRRSGRVAGGRRRGAGAAQDGSGAAKQGGSEGTNYGSVPPSLSQRQQQQRQTEQQPQQQQQQRMPTQTGPQGGCCTVM